MVAVAENTLKEAPLKRGQKLALKTTFKEDVNSKLATTVALENKIIAASFTNITNLKGLVYTVQIGAYINTITSKQLLNLSPIYYESLNNSIIRYLLGAFKTLKEAKMVENKIKALGIEDAYVVAYKEGHRIHVKTHLKIME